MSDLKWLVSELENAYELERRRYSDGVHQAVENCYAHVRRELQVDTPNRLLNAICAEVSWRVSICADGGSVEVRVDKVAGMLIGAADDLGLWEGYEPLREAVVGLMRGEVPDHAPWTDIDREYFGLLELKALGSRLEALRGEVGD